MPACLLVKRSYGLGIPIKKVVKNPDVSKFGQNLKSRTAKIRPQTMIISKTSAKIPITTRFHLNYLTKKCFTSDFINTESYEYATDISFNLKKQKGKKYQYDDFVTLPDKTGYFVKNSKYGTRLTLENNVNSKGETIKSGNSEDLHWKKEKSQIRNDRKSIVEVKSAKNKQIIENTNILQAETRDGAETCLQSIRDKTFCTLWRLEGNLHVATGETPFYCNYNGCLKSYTDGSNLRAHQRDSQHHAWKWVCPKCNKPFSLQRYLTRHKDKGCAKYSSQDFNLLSIPKETISVEKILDNYSIMNDEIKKLLHILSWVNEPVLF